STVGSADVRNSAMPARLAEESRQSLAVGFEARERPSLSDGFASQIWISRAGSRNGSGSSRTAWTRLKMALVAPMPRPSVAIAVAAKTGERCNARSAARTSAHMEGRAYTGETG